MSYADLPPGACFVPELHLKPCWLVKYDGHAILMTDDEFWAFADRVKYDGVEYEAEPVQRVPELIPLLKEALI